jgi:uncharacterized damage-inducible protein DinB
VYARPQANEYAEYYGRYVAEVPDGDVLAFLENQRAATHELLGGLSEEQGNQRYAPGKWSIKEVLGHIIDTERIFCVRALAFARQDPSELPGFDQDHYVAHGAFDARALESCLREFDAVRDASLELFRGLDDQVHEHQGRANAVGFSVRSIPWILAGHAKHHLGVLQGKYLG